MNAGADRRITVVLLAAGSSRRFGAAKLVQPLHGVPLVRHCARAAIDSSADDVVVIVGGHAPAVRIALEGLDVRFVVNDRHAEGMGTSIATGAMAAREADAVIIALADQPGVTAAVFDVLCSAYRSGAGQVIVPVYRDGGSAPPILFANGAMVELEALEGEAGARGVIERDPSRVVRVPIDSAFPADIDTPEDLREMESSRETGPTSV